MDEILEKYSEYSQFIVMGLVFLVAGIVYTIYAYYQKQKDIVDINNNINNIDLKPNEEIQQPPDFIPIDTFKGYNQGYIFKKDNKGIGYYKDK